ncbi:MAG TPA: diphthine--ammonia ligase [Thermodesulfobacteriota bacterium]|nr:diphthine--ammonia ligase [Thermodesulfobacteriota bacterium]
MASLTKNKSNDAKKVIFAWSGGKDSSMALDEISRRPDVRVVALLTTVTRDYKRISMHGVRETLLERQARSIGAPLEKVFISKNSSNEEYEAGMRTLLLKYKAEGAESVAFGDIFLEDLKKYREDNLAKIGMSGIFPIWKKDSKELAKGFVKKGFKAIITCVDTDKLDARFAGRLFDEGFLSELPATVDPCGENGEFHSFAFDGPIFKTPVEFKIGETVLRDSRFNYCDLLD